MIDNIKQYILELVALHDGEWSWYQIDRALSNSDLEVVGPFHKEIKELIAEGLLEVESSDLPDNTCYRITNKGRKAVSQKIKC